MTLRDKKILEEMRASGSAAAARAIALRNGAGLALLNCGDVRPEVLTKSRKASATKPAGKKFVVAPKGSRQRVNA